MTPRFLNGELATRSRDGRNVVLTADAYYQAADGTLYLMPVGATSDGASTPKEVWPLIPPFGAYWPAAVLHDCAYRDTLMRAQFSTLNPQPCGPMFVRATLPKSDCDALLDEAMAALGVGRLERKAIYDAVVLAGTSSFDADRAAGWKAWMQ